MAGKLVAENGNSYPISEQGLMIGRGSQCEVKLADPQASRLHCKIINKQDGYWVEDNLSNNGTYVNERKVTSCQLQSGDRISIGTTAFVFLLEGATVESPSSASKAGKPWEACLTIRKKNKILHNLVLQKSIYAIGRSDDNDIRLNDNQISAQHVELFWKDQQWWIRDLQSRNGTFLNNKKIQLAALSRGDTVRLGQEFFCVFQNTQWDSQLCKNRNYLRIVAGLVVILLLSSGIMVVRKAFLPGKWNTAPANFPGNLVADFSFEEGLNWQLQEGMSLHVGNAKSGKTCLYFASADGKPESLVHEAHYADSLSLQYGKTYKASGWLATTNLQGVAGFKLKWLDHNNEPVSTESYSPFITGPSAGWQKVEWAAYPPPQAEQMKFSCFIAGKAESVYFDDVAIMEQPGKKRSALEHANWRIFLDERGIAEIYYGTQAVVGNAKLLIRGTDNQTLATQTFATGKTIREASRITWQGSLYRLPQFQPWGQMSIEFETITDGIRLSITLTPQGIVTGETLEYVLSIPFAYAAKKVKWGNQECSFSQEQLPKTLQLPISYILWEGVSPKTGFFYPSPIEANVSRGEYGIHLHHSLPLPFPGGWEMRFRGNIFQENRELQEWEELAATLDNEFAWGQASLIYQKIVDKFISYPGAEKAQKRLQELLKLYPQDLQSLDAMVARARLLKTIDGYGAVLRTCETLCQKWQGFAPATKLPEWSGLLAQEQRQLQQTQDNENVALLIQHAIQYQQEEKYGLAWACYQEITERYANISLPNRQLLEKIKDIERHLELPRKK